MRTQLRSKEIRGARRAAFLGLLAAAVLLGLGNCTTDSPTEPRQQAPPSTGGGGGTAPSGSWLITVTSSRAELEVNSGRSALITVGVRDAANNALPPNGAIVTLVATLGEFGAAGSGDSSVLLQLQQGLAQALFFPGDEVGTAIIQARLENSTGQTSVRIVEPTTPIGTPTPRPFFIERVEPDEGSPDGGEIVRIIGQEFEEPVRVFFGSLPAEVLSVTSGVIRVRTPRNDDFLAQPPPLGRLPVDVEVTINVNEANEASDTLLSGFTYVRGGSGGPGDLQPIIFSVTPNVGPNEGGTRVVINGDGFQSPVQVLFEGPVSLEAEIESVSRTQIVAISPAAVGFGAGNRNQNVAITVRNLTNGLTATRQAAFRYGIAFQVFGIDPDEGPFFGGTQVTIFGEGFDEPLVVDIGGVRQQVISVTGNEILIRTAAIRVTTCADQTSGNVTVRHLESDLNATSPEPFTYLVEEFAPVIDRTTPTTIPQSGGNITIQGRNFRSPLLANIQSERTGAPVRPVLVTSVSAGSISANVAAFPDSDFDFTTCDDNGDGFQGQRFITTPATLAVTDEQTTCVAEFSVNLQPSNTSCRNDVAPTPTPTLAPTATPTP
jgi:hypothetical protein